MLTPNINRITALGQMDLSAVRCTHGRAGQHLRSRQSGHEVRGNPILGGDPQTETERATLPTHCPHLFRPGRGDRWCFRNERLRVHRRFQSHERWLCAGRRCALSIRQLLRVLRREVDLARRNKLRGQSRSWVDHAGQHGWGKIESHNRPLHGLQSLWKSETLRSWEMGDYSWRGDICESYESLGRYHANILFALKISAI